MKQLKSFTFFTPLFLLYFFSFAEFKLGEATLSYVPETTLRQFISSLCAGDAKGSA